MQASFIVRAYNAEQTIKRTIASALAQDFSRENYEIVVVDDGSTDKTSAIAASFRESNIRIVRQDNKGIVEAGNTGLREANGDIVVLLDADDEAMPSSLSAAVAVMRGDIAYVYGNYFEEYQGKREEIHAADPFKAPAGAFAWRRTSLLAEGGFPAGTIFPEYDILFKMWGRWRGARIAGPVFIYHRSEESMTGDPKLVRDSLEALKRKYPEREHEIGQIRSYMLS